jgi:dolichyl-phosphate-mannose-protein mannosyltransferase
MKTRRKKLIGIQFFFSSFSGFSIAIAFLYFWSLFLRFWGLARFNTLVFDEQHYVKYAKDYLNHLPFFDVHPPLGKYLITLAIWFSNLPFWDASGQITPFDYRWLNALAGSFVPLIVAGIAYQLSHRRSYAFIAGLFASADGLLLVESRYALLNIYLILFGLLGQLCFLIAIENQSILRSLYLTLSGVFFGASVSVKWYGLGFMLGIYLFWLTIQIFYRLPENHSIVPKIKSSLAWNLFRLKLFPLLFYLVIIPVIVYYLLWLPHLTLYNDRGFWELHQKSLEFHQQLGSNAKVHPYCSNWYSWVFMIRPIAYFYQKIKHGSSPIIYDVHGMGNPILWWFAAIAIVFLAINIARQLTTSQSQFWISSYILIDYGVNWLPWAMVHRCAFLYYYMPASIYGFLAIAYLVDSWLLEENLGWRAIALSIIFLIILAFTYWLPIYLGLPLSNEEFHQRMLFNSWY